MPVASGPDVCLPVAERNFNYLAIDDDDEETASKLFGSFRQGHCYPMAMPVVCIKDFGENLMFWRQHFCLIPSLCGQQHSVLAATVCACCPALILTGESQNLCSPLQPVLDPFFTRNMFQFPFLTGRRYLLKQLLVSPAWVHSSQVLQNGRFTVGLL